MRNDLASCAPWIACATASLLASCTGLGVSAQAGYAELALGGDVSLTTAGSSSPNIDQDIESAFGLGDDQGSPYGRVQLDLGTPVLTLTGFDFEESGRGTLQADFGNINAGTDVLTDVQITNLKASLTFDIGIGPVTVAPGIGVDWFAFDFVVQDTIGFVTEDVELEAPVPMAFVRGEVDLGIAGGIVELGYAKVPEIDEVEGSILDIEALVEFRPIPKLHLFAGYRAQLLEIEGEVDDDAFDLDMDLTGFLLGGGIRF